MNKEELIKRLALSGVIGAMTGGLTIALIKTISRNEVCKKTKEMDKKISEIKEFTENTNKDLNRFRAYNEELEKKTIRNLGVEELAKLLKERDDKLIDKSKEVLRNSLELYIDSKVKDYSEYMMGQIDEVYERLEQAEKFVQGVGNELIGDKTEQVLNEIFEEKQGEENVTEVKSDNEVKEVATKKKYGKKRVGKEKESEQ